MSLVLTPIVEFYRNILQPVQTLQMFGVTLTSLDLAAAFRLCLVLRQIREQLFHAHLRKAASGVRVQGIEKRSFVREASAVLIVVYGGEALTCEWRHCLRDPWRWLMRWGPILQRRCWDPHHRS